MNILLIGLLILGVIIITAVITFYLTVVAGVDYLTGDFWDELIGKKKRK